MKQITCEQCEKPNCSAFNEKSKICVRCALENNSSGENMDDTKDDEKKDDEEEKTNDEELK